MSTVSATDVEETDLCSDLATALASENEHMLKEGRILQ
jgi:hypothetical protein